MTRQHLLLRRAPPGEAWGDVSDGASITGGSGGASSVREVRTSASSVPAFVPRSLLEWDLPDAPAEDLALFVENELLRLGACEARLDLSMGSVLRSLTPAILAQLGFGRLGTFTNEVLGMSERQASELKTLDRRSRDLPRIREAFLAGLLPRAKATLIVGIATRETEAAWIRIARSRGTRGLEDAVRAERQSAKKGRPVSIALDPAPGMTRVRLRACVADAMFHEHVVLPMLRSVVGMQGPTHELLEALAADMLSELGPEREAPEPAPAPNKSRRRRVLGRGRRKVAASDARRLSRAMHRLALRLGGVPAVAWPDVSERKRSAREIRHLLELLRSWQRGLEWQRSRLLAIFQARGWARLRGHPHFADWHQRRLGLAPVEVQGLLRLANALADLPVIEESWQRGHIDVPMARKLARIAEPATDAEWAAHARRATRKRVELDVADQLALRAALHRPRWLAVSGGAPRTGLPMSRLRVPWERILLRIERARRAQEKAGFVAVPDAFDLAGELTDVGACVASLLDGPRFARERTSIVFDAPEETAKLIRQALRQTARATGWALDDGGCLRVMGERFAATHVFAAFEDLSLRARILQRDGWECGMPHCRSRRHLDVHHVVFRSRGGGDEWENLLTLCSACHRLLHDGCLAVEGHAPDGLLVRVGRQGPDAEWFRDGIRAGPEARAA